MSDPILDIQRLSVFFFMPETRAEMPVVRDVSLSVERGSWTSIVGESGSGKTVTALSIARLAQPLRDAGEILFYEKKDSPLSVMKLGEKELLGLRGGRIAYVFQDPGSSLNPVLTVGAQIEETVRAHFPSEAKAAGQKALEFLSLVKMSDPERVHRAFPHELSGGMRQRVMIAMALISSPSLLVADEPTTALDVTIEKEIMSLLEDLRAKKSLSILFITHNLRLACGFSDEIYVMRQGSVVEKLSKRSGFSSKTDYAKKLFSASVMQGDPKSLIEV